MNSKEKVLYKAVKEKLHHKGTKGPQKFTQMLGQKTRHLADLMGETNTYRVERAKSKHELKELRREK